MIASAQILRPTWAEIDLSALGRNLVKLRGLAGPRCRVLFVVKANAYGHGVQAVARYAQSRGLCEMFGVSSVEEGLALRGWGIALPILVLGSIYPFEAFRHALAHNLSVTVSSLDAARQIERAAEETGHVARCHVKVDTGMGRIGARRPGAVKILNFLRGCAHVEVEGVYTHFSCADTDAAYTRTQLRHFTDTLTECSRNGIAAGIRHCANSAAALNFPESRLDMIRPGFAAYGLADGFEPVLSLKTGIVYIKDLRGGASVSYGRSYRCRGLARVATVPAGYGDGYTRALSNRAEIVVRGRRCRVIGNITMDMLMADVSAVPDAAVGDEAVLIGRQGGEAITAAELAGLAGTIPYEITTAISARVPRVFINETDAD
ncbi:MAG: alanine racemase [Elusimicrobiaceae bacterium]|nr:alanine racemase [Elusimicrobiaceae bacterium]